MRLPWFRRRYVGAEVEGEGRGAKPVVPVGEVGEVGEGACHIFWEGGLLLFIGEGLGLIEGGRVLRR